MSEMTAYEMLDDIENYVVKFKHEQYPRPKQQPLTDEQMKELFNRELNKKGANWLDVCRAIEQAHGIGVEE